MRVDGVLVVDYPPRKRRNSRRCSPHESSRRSSCSPRPTPEARIAAVAKVARGYVYYVSLKGVTGAGHLDPAEVARKLATIRRHVDLPVGVGFGIRDAASAQAIRRSCGCGGHRQPHHPGDRERRAGHCPRAGRAWLAGIRRALDTVRKQAA